MKVLVTGGAGFIGSHVVDGYLSQGHDVAVVDDLSAGKMENVSKKAVFYKLSVQSDALKSVFESFKPDIVNHHAAHIDLRKSVENPRHDTDVNVIGSLNVLVLSVQYKVKKIIFASTGGAIYGEPEKIPVDETSQPMPLSPYGANKLVVEHYIRIWNYIHGLDYTILRYPNVYGPRQDPKGEAGVVAIFSLKMLKNQQPIIFGDGSKTRDYLYVEDVVKANLLALEKGSKEILNLGWGQEISDLDVFLAVKKAAHKNINPVYESVRPGEVYRISLNARKAEKILGWKPTVSFEEGTRRCIDFYKKNLLHLM